MAGNSVRRVLITSGGTSEKIDDIRKITNISTGRLGSLIADQFAGQGAEVTYITAPSAILPVKAMYKIKYITDTEDLRTALEKLLRNTAYDCVVHAMAVSDYRFDFASSLEVLSEAVKNGIDITSDKNKEQLTVSGVPPASGKIGSDLKNLVLVLKPAPKIIRIIKNIRPHTLLFGFKLLVNAHDSELCRAARRVLQHNDCDYVVANDLRNISGDRHEAVIFDAGGHEKILCHSKQEIAENIVRLAYAQRRE
jgi:phosphopantothenate--cysteine ligase